MKARKKAAIAIAFALMTLIARPQIMFAQAPPTPIVGSWDALKAVPPGDEVTVTLRNGRTLKGRLISVSDTVLALRKDEIITDLPRADALKVYRVLRKSATKSTMIGLGIGAGAGAALAAAAIDTGESAENALGILIIGSITAGIGALVGYLSGSGKRRELIYETR